MANSNRLVITDRDRALILDLFLQRALKRDQIIDLHFSSLSRANKRLTQLCKGNLVRRIQTLTDGQSLYGPGPAALPILEELVEGDDLDIRAQCRREVAPLFLAHTLGLTDLRLMAVREAKERNLEVEFLPEVVCRHEYSVRSTPSGPWQREILKPDAFVAFRDARTALAGFIELDLGYMSLSRFKAKLTRYKQYLSLGLHCERIGLNSFAVLTVTTGTRRLEHLAETAPDPRVITCAFTTLDNLAEFGFLGEAWLLSPTQSFQALPWRDLT